MKFGCILILVTVLVAFNSMFVLNSEALADSCDGDPNTGCAVNEACCITGEGGPTCTLSTGPSFYGCLDCDSGQDACEKCCFTGGSSADACDSGYANVSYTWIGGFTGNCCGNDGASDDFDASGGSVCCCDGYTIDDAQCSGHSNYWCADGYYCDATYGDVTRDTGLPAGGTDYTIGGDDITCGCDSSGVKCDNDQDATAEGICASSTCDSGTVAMESSIYYSTCSLGRECDNYVDEGFGENPRYVRDGICISQFGSGQWCINSAFQDAVATYDMSVSAECGSLSGCSAGDFDDNDGSNACDATVTSGGSLCVDNVDTWTPGTWEGYCVDGNCVTSGTVRLNCGASCTSADMSDANMASGCDTSGDA
ncbi:MAG: hypothetical protein KKC05_01660, partial [Nanoarchaeota archaeon]|nr:hypothetical protein [Nanoarchaeota archaeon]